MLEVFSDGSQKNGRSASILEMLHRRLTHCSINASELLVSVSNALPMLEIEKEM